MCTVPWKVLCICCFVTLSLEGVMSGSYCSGYWDSDNDYQYGFWCPSFFDSSDEIYCCGSSTYKYCCSTDPDTYIGLGVAAIVGIVFGVLIPIGLIIACIVACVCCFGNGSSGGRTTTVVGGTQVAAYPQVVTVSSMAQAPPPPYYASPGYAAPVAYGTGTVTTVTKV
ncbi:uncharacterized protein LOC144451874 [Glandiceps talaboti]